MADATTKSAVAEQVVANVTTTAPATATPPQHGLHGAFQQPHPSMVAQQLAAMDGSYLTATYPAETYPASTYPAETYPTATYPGPAATYPDVFYPAQSETVEFTQPPQPALQPQTQVSQLIKSGPFLDRFLFVLGCSS